MAKLFKSWGGVKIYQREFKQRQYLITHFYCKFYPAEAKKHIISQPSSFFNEASLSTIFSAIFVLSSIAPAPLSPHMRTFSTGGISSKPKLFNLPICSQVSG